jgi:Membrane protease subunits, stomatin/prohibitin homologs
MEKRKLNKLFIFIPIVMFILLILMASSIRTIQSGFVGVKTRFGAVQDNVLVEGINFKLPFIENIIKIDCRVQKAETRTNAASKDLQTIDTKIAVNYSIKKDVASTLYKDIGTNFKSIIIEPAILESIKAVTATYTAEELITKRAEVSLKMSETLAAKIEDSGFTIVDFNITDLNFSAEYDAAIEKKQVIEQETKAAQYELEKARIENEKRIVDAEANAKVMELQNVQITDKTLELKKLEIQQSMMEKWNGVLPSTMLGDGINSLFNIN